MPVDSLHAVAAATAAANTPDSVFDAKKAPKGEKTKPVEGHSYADITAGPRNGMYVNPSGKDRLVVCLKPKADADDTASAKPKADPKSTTPSGTTGSA